MKTIPVAKLYDRQFRMLNAPQRIKSRLMPVLTRLTADAGSNLDTAFEFEIVLGDPPNQRNLTLKMEPLLRCDQVLDEPHFIGSSCEVIFFIDTLFICDPLPATPDEQEFVLLSAKRNVLIRGVSSDRLKSEVAALEALITPHESLGRPSIPDAVKRAVWVRDSGSCTQCGARDGLQFDHIIPFSKGGGNSVENLQILCARCNRSKSNRI